MVHVRARNSLIAIAVILGLGLPAWRWIARPPETWQPPLVEPGPIAVRTLVLAPRDVELEVEAYGTLHARRRARLAPEVGGRIERVLEDWRPGRRVAAGEELLALDATRARLERDRARAAEQEAEAALERARADLETAPRRLEILRERERIATRSHERLANLEAAGGEAERNVDLAMGEVAAARLAVIDAEAAVERARVTVAAARAALESARAVRGLASEQLDRHVLRVPFDGELAGRAPSAGTQLAPGELVAELIDRSELQLVAQVAEGDVDGLRPGLAALVEPTARPGLELAARVAAVGVIADPTTRSVPVEIDLDGSGAESGGGPDNGHAAPALAPGQFASARIAAGTERGALVVERRQFVWRDGLPVAFVLEDAADGPVVRARELALGRPVGEGFVVEGGLAPGESLVVWPLDRLLDGMRVAPLPAHEARSGGDAANAR